MQHLFHTLSTGFQSINPILLDILKARNIRATFFVTNDAGKLTAYPNIIRRAINEGHEIGNHTLNHLDLTTLTDQEAIAEVAGCRDLVVAGATLPTTIIRPPYGAVNDHLKSLFMSEFGYMHRRVQVEIAWFIALSDAGFSEFKPLSAAARAHLLGHAAAHGAED